MTLETPLYCAYHPGVETALRCNRCEKPICIKCAIRTPTGYRCKDCVRGQQKLFETAEWYDYVTGFIVGGILSTIASFLVSLIGFIGIWGIFLMVAAAPTAGVAISEVIRRVTRRRRSQSLFITIGIGVALGILPMTLISLLSGNWFGLLYQGAYLVLVVPTVYYRLSGIQLFK